MAPLPARCSQDAARASCGHISDIVDLAESCDNRFLASCSNDQDVPVWFLHSGVPLAVLPGHGGVINSVAWSLECHRSRNSFELQPLPAALQLMEPLMRGNNGVDNGAHGRRGHRHRVVCERVVGTRMTSRLTNVRANLRATASGAVRKGTDLTVIMMQQPCIAKHCQQRAKRALLPPLQPPVALTAPHCIPFCLPRPIPRSLRVRERVTSERASSVTSQKPCCGSNAIRPRRPEQMNRLAWAWLLCRVGVRQAAESIGMGMDMEATVGICCHISCPDVGCL